MRRLPAARPSFTVLELMVVVAVMMVLTALAIPMIHDTQLKARRAELLPVVDALETANIAYHTSNDAWWVMAGYEPDAWPGKSTRPWAGVSEIGFAPDGEVRGSYVLAGPGQSICVPNTFAQNTCSLLEESCTGGMTDLDEDTNRACADATPTAHAGLDDPTFY